jgi:methionine-rich copper-binding protein CopC
MPMTIRLLPLAAATIVLAVAGTPTAAHPRLVAATPAINGVVAATKAVVLKFNERLIGQFSGLAISRSGAGMPTVGQVKTVIGPDGRTLVAHLAAPLSTGRYVLAWHAVSTDTHRVAGSYRFAVR